MQSHGHLLVQGLVWVRLFRVGCTGYSLQLFPESCPPDLLSNNTYAPCHCIPQIRREDSTHELHWDYRGHKYSAPVHGFPLTHSPFLFVLVSFPVDRGDPSASRGGNHHWVSVTGYTAAPVQTVLDHRTGPCECHPRPVLFHSPEPEGYR